MYKKSPNPSVEKKRILKQLDDLSKNEYLFKFRIKGVEGKIFNFFKSNLFDLEVGKDGIFVTPKKPLLEDIGENKWAENRVKDFYNNCENIEDFKITNLIQYRKRVSAGEPIYSLNTLFEMMQLTGIIKKEGIKKSLSRINKCFTKFGLKGISLADYKENIKISLSLLPNIKATKGDSVDSKSNKVIPITDKGKKGNLA
jgi:hypothetical protein